MYIYTHPVYPRRSSERFFKQAYNVGMVLNFAALVISFTDFASRIGNTYQAYWSASAFELTPPLLEILGNCTYTSSISINGVKADSSLTMQSLPLPFLFTTAFIIGVFAGHMFLIICDFFAKISFTLNIRALRYRGVYIRSTVILVTLITITTTSLIASIAASNGVRSYMQSYIDTCATRYMVLHGDKFVEAEYDTDVVFGTNLNWILTAICLNYACYLAAMIHVLIYGSKEENARLQAMEHPWEMGFFCRPNKPMLVEWCKFRKQRAEEVMSGDFEADNLSLLPPPSQFRQQNYPPHVEDGGNNAYYDNREELDRREEEEEGGGGGVGIDEFGNVVQSQVFVGEGEEGGEEGRQKKKKHRYKKRRHHHDRPDEEEGGQPDAEPTAAPNEGDGLNF